MKVLFFDFLLPFSPFLYFFRWFSEDVVWYFAQHFSWPYDLEPIKVCQVYLLNLLHYNIAGRGVETSAGDWSVQACH